MSETRMQWVQTTILLFVLYTLVTLHQATQATNLLLHDQQHERHALQEELARLRQDQHDFRLDMKLQDPCQACDRKGQDDEAWKKPREKKP